MLETFSKNQQVINPSDIRLSLVPLSKVSGSSFLDKKNIIGRGHSTKDCRPDSLKEINRQLIW